MTPKATLTNKNFSLPPVTDAVNSSLEEERQAGGIPNCFMKEPLKKRVIVEMLSNIVNILKTTDLHTLKL